MKPALRVGIFVAAILSALSSFGGARHFAFLYEANTSAPGSLELENWMTSRHATGPGRFDQVDFRHELEYGVTDKFQASIYLADWRYQNDREHSGFAYSDTAIELIYNLTNPVVDPVGLSIYGELRAGDRLLELESKLIAQKNFGPLILAYNATLESVWEWHDEEKIRNLFVGPNVSYRRGNWFVTITALAQATDTEDEPDFQLRYETF